MEYKDKLQMTCEDLTQLLRSQNGPEVYLNELRAIEDAIAQCGERRELENLGGRIRDLMRTLASVHGSAGNPLLNADRYKQFVREVFDESTA
jgi:hypothetical protein